MFASGGKAQIRVRTSPPSRRFAYSPSVERSIVPPGGADAKPKFSQRVNAGRRGLSSAEIEKRELDAGGLN